MLAPRTPAELRRARVAELMRHSRGLGNGALIAHMLAGQTLGEGVLPPGLGLEPADFDVLLDAHFDSRPARVETSPRSGPALQVEFPDLLAFLQAEADPAIAGSRAMARIVATACMGADHLWQDLGLPSRAELSQLMALNFPLLARANARDMKWKKFLYRELCQREGIYVCASPSCEACNDYAVCFGPER